MLAEEVGDELETPVLRPLVWVGSSKRDIQAFPDEAKKLMGDELQLIQFGGMPKEEIEEGHCHAEERCGFDQKALRRSKGAGE